MSGTLTNRSESASPFPSYSLSPSGSHSSSSTLYASYSANYSTTLSATPSPGTFTPTAYTPSSLASLLPIPTPSQTPSSLAPVAPTPDNVTISRQQLIYIGVPIAVVILIILSCTYNAHREKKRLNRLLTRYTSTPSTIKINPVAHNNSAV
jgi:hypothetical protein